MSAKQPVRCAVYTRKSSEDGLEQEFNSLDAQREACEAYVSSQRGEGWLLLSDRYDDGGYSGGTLKRPALQQLLSDIEAGHIDVVIVYKIDRLSRSLMDFAKLVEVFDRKSVTFVSITQSFNTTTSMGRLTFNVLLSFAQFEREVTGERIRDKFAASKRKGMWMGGCPPLGYDIVSRKLVVNASEAAAVNLIYRRYLELGCVRTLKANLEQFGIVAKRWTSSTGVLHGGKPLDRGALYCLLKNRLYLGQTVHKGHSYSGEHQSIVDLELYNAVQQRLREGNGRQRGKANTEQDALLAGVIFDDTDTAMTPSYSIKLSGARYRYYVSRPRLLGLSSKAAISRIAAPPLEHLVCEALRRLQLVTGSDIPSVSGIVSRLEIHAHSIVLVLDQETTGARWKDELGQEGHFSFDEILGRMRSNLREGELLEMQSKMLRLTLPGAKFRGGKAAMLSTGSADLSQGGCDIGLIKAIARAHAWKDLMLKGEAISIQALAARVQQERRHVGRTLNLAFLSPEIVRAILDGNQLGNLKLAHLLDAEIPLSWSDQNKTFLAS